MFKKTLKFSFKAILFNLKVLGALGVLWFLLFSVFAWRISYAPWDISFAKDYLTAFLHDEMTGNYALMDRVTVHWPDVKGAIYLEFSNAQLMNSEGVSLLSVDEAAISVSGLSLFQFRVRPTSIILRGPSLRFVRTDDNQFKFDLGLGESSDISEERIAVTTRIFNYIARPGVQAKNRSLISRLEVFAIEDARFSVNDQKTQQTWSFPDFDLALYSTRLGLKGEINVVMPEVGLEESGVHIDMNYVWDQKTVSLITNFKSMDVKALASKIPELAILSSQDIIFDARAETLLDEHFNPTDIRFILDSEKGTILHDALSKEAIPYNHLSVHATYNYPSQTLKLTESSVNLSGVIFNSKAEVSKQDGLLKGPVKVWIDNTRHSDFIKLWPTFLEGENAETWIVERMSDGVFKDLSVDFNVIEQAAGAKDFSVSDLIVDFKFEDMSLDYQAPLDKGENLLGSGRFDMNADSLSVDITSGKIGGFNLYDTKLIFNALMEKGQGDANLSFGLRGRIPKMLRYIAKEPIGLNNIGLDPKVIKGNADLRVGLSFPTRKNVKKEEFVVTVDGTLSDVVFPDVVETLDLNGGPFKLSIDKGVIKVGGDGKIESRDASLGYETFFDSSDKPYKEKISVKIAADPNLRSLLGIDLSDFIEGSVFVDVVYASYRGGTAKADIRADVSPAVFFVEPFGFVKPSGEKASAQMSAYFKDKEITEIKNLEGQGALFSFSDASVQFHKKNGEVEVLSGAFPVFTLDQSKGGLKFIYDDGGILNIDMDADTLDAQPFMEPSGESDEPYESPAMRISMQAEEIITAPERSVRKGVLNLHIDDQGVFSQWVFDAVAGAGKVSARYQPDDEGKRNFTMRAEDAGAFLKALEIYDTMVGGVMDIKGVPLRNDGDRSLKGKARIKDFRVVDAPVFAQVLSLLSLQAIPETGMEFEKLEADFDWIYKSGGSVLKLKDGRTSGNSLGLLFDGRYDSGGQYIDLSGTVVPMSGLNKVIGKIPLVGDILTGGSGGIFAATFKIEGESDDPKVSANPLSVITPGILRRILWE